MPLEKDIVRACRGALDKSGVLTIKHTGGPFAEVGVSDLICVIPGGRALFVECKRDKSCKPTPVQMQFLARVGAAGALTWVVRSYEDIDQLVKQVRLITQKSSHM